MGCVQFGFGHLLSLSGQLQELIKGEHGSYLGDRYSRKYLMAGGVFLWSVLTLLGSLVSGNPSNQGEGWCHPDFLLFLTCRAMVGIGEASYSTMAHPLLKPTYTWPSLRCHKWNKHGLKKSISENVKVE